MDDDEVDRAAILRRRALFVASALAGLAGAREARADEPPPDVAPATPDVPSPNAPSAPPPCEPVSEPSPAEVEEAKLHYQHAVNLLEEGDFEAATIELARVSVVMLT
jgi:hypothetical protein